MDSQAGTEAPSRSPIDLDAEKPTKQLYLAYLQSFFICVATILGTGILGLPLKIYKCGFTPFVTTFVPSFFMQVLVVHFFTEMLQICDAALQESLHEEFSYNHLDDVPLVDRTHASKTSQSVKYQKAPMSNMVSIGDSNQLSETSSTSSKESNNGGEVAVDDSQVSSPNLHILGKLFLPAWLQVVFYLTLGVNFACLLTSYALAGGESFGQLLNVDYRYLIPPFLWILAFVIIVGFSFIKPIISTLTFAKGSVFILMAVVGVILGNEIQSPIITDWSTTYQPLLMEMVALGGLFLVMPLLYGQFRGSKEKLIGFKYSIYAALLFSAILNVVWAWSVLSVVPQFDETCYNITENSVATLHEASTTEQPKVKICDETTSLEAAEVNGMISTVPFTAVVKAQSSSFQWISVLVQLFVIISITVSFLTLGSSMYHCIIGAVNYLISLRRKHSSSESQPITSSFVPSDSVWRGLAGFTAFLIVFIIAISEPQSFVKLLDLVVSTCQNVICGPIFFIMYRRTYQPPFRNLTIPLRTDPKFRPLFILCMLYFTGGIVFLIIELIADL